MSFITLEDINTWIMKYIDNDEPLVHQAPVVVANHSLYRGNENDISDLITLPEGMEYTISYQGKPFDKLYIPEDYEEDTIRLRITTKSYEPYIGLDVYLDVNVETKQITSIEDLNTYSYGEITGTLYVNGTINNDIYIVGGEIDFSKLTINGNVTFDGIEISDTLITNNGTLLVKNCEFSTTAGKFMFDNNNTLTITDCTSENPKNLILNKGTLNFNNNNLRFSNVGNQALIHSEEYPNSITGNTLSYPPVCQVEGYGICIIRTNNMDTKHFLANNTPQYNCFYQNDDVRYHVMGKGVAYCTIDDDTIHFNNLEVWIE